MMAFPPYLYGCRGIPRISKPRIRQTGLRGGGRSPDNTKGECLVEFFPIYYIRHLLKRAWLIQHAGQAADAINQ